MIFDSSVTNVTLNVTIIDDNNVEINESFLLVLEILTSGINLELVPNNNAIVTIVMVTTTDSKNACCIHVATLQRREMLYHACTCTWDSLGSDQYKHCKFAFVLGNSKVEFTNTIMNDIVIYHKLCTFCL